MRGHYEDATSYLFWAVSVFSIQSTALRRNGDMDLFWVSYFGEGAFYIMYLQYIGSFFYVPVSIRLPS